MISQFMCLCHGHMDVEVTEDLLARYPTLDAPVGSVVATLRTIEPGKTRTVGEVMRTLWNNSNGRSFSSTFCIPTVLHCSLSIILSTTTNMHRTLSELAI